MLITLNGLIIGQRVAGENNCFLDILTDKLGLIEVKAHGAKKLSGRLAGAVSLFCYSKLCLNKSGSRYTVNSAELIYSFHGISGSLEALSLAAYFAEIIKYTATEEENHSDLLRFTCMTFYKLQKQDRPLPLIKAIFEFRVISHIGFMPDLRACKSCICYEHEVMYFIVEKGCLYCEECYKELSYSEDNSFALTPSVLHTLRYVAYSETEKLYNFSLSEQSTELFGAVAEFYLLHELGRTFKTLEYYKSINGNRQ